MFGSIIFDLILILAIVPLSTLVSYFSLHPLRICYVARCAHFTISSGRRGALFFLWEQMYTSDSTFIKMIKHFVCHCISMPP